MEKRENSSEVTWGSACILYARGEMSVQDFIASQRNGPNIGEALLRLSQKYPREEQNVQEEIAQPQIVLGGEYVPLKHERLGRVAQAIKHMFLRHPRD